MSRFGLFNHRRLSNTWKRHIQDWIYSGFQAVEALIGESGWALGDMPGLADAYLLPQIYAARRFGLNLNVFPRISRVEALAAEHPGFHGAHPANQIDAPPPT